MAKYPADEATRVNVNGIPSDPYPRPTGGSVTLVHPDGTKITYPLVQMAEGKDGWTVTGQGMLGGGPIEAAQPETWRDRPPLL